MLHAYGIISLYGLRTQYQELFTPRCPLLSHCFRFQFEKDGVDLLKFSLCQVPKVKGKAVSLLYHFIAYMQVVLRRAATMATHKSSVHAFHVLTSKHVHV